MKSRVERFLSNMALGGFIVSALVFFVGLYYFPTRFGILTSSISFAIGWTLLSIAGARDWI